MSYDNKIDARVNISKWIFCLWIFPYCWQEQEQKAEEERIRMENILSGNPLLNLTGPSQPQANFKVKRRYCTVNKLEILYICIQYRLYIKYKLYVYFFGCIKLYGSSTLFGTDRNVWRLRHLLIRRSRLT